MYSKILIATDFDEVGHKATQHAKKLADLCKAELHLVHVIEPMPAYAYPGFSGFQDVEDSLQEQAEEALKAVANELGVPPARQHVAHGSTKNEIIRMATQVGADLIVCGSHAKHGLELLLGSTANSILHSAMCDVLVVRGDNVE